MIRLAQNGEIAGQKDAMQNHYKKNKHQQISSH